MDAIIDGMKVRVDFSVTRTGGPGRHDAHERRSRSRSPRGRRGRSRSPRRRSYSRSRSR